jgi:hypothetical protein
MRAGRTRGGLFRTHHPFSDILGNVCYWPENARLQLGDYNSRSQLNEGPLIPILADLAGWTLVKPGRGVMNCQFSFLT